MGGKTRFPNLTTHPRRSPTFASQQADAHSRSAILPSDPTHASRSTRSTFCAPHANTPHVQLPLPHPPFRTHTQNLTSAPLVLGRQRQVRPNPTLASQCTIELPNSRFQTHGCVPLGEIYLCAPHANTPHVQLPLPHPSFRTHTHTCRDAS